MKKILSSLLCVGFLSTFANADVISVDVMQTKVNHGNGLDNTRPIQANFNIKTYKDNAQDVPFVWSFGINSNMFSSDMVENEQIIGHTRASLVDFSLMGGYGLFVEDTFKTRINILAGLSHMNVEFADQDYTAPVDSDDRKSIESFKANAVKVGVSSFSTFNNGLVASLDMYIKYFLNTKHDDIKLSSRTKYDIEGMVGYNFGKDDNGFIVGVKGGFHDDFISKSGSIGLSLGYVF